MSRRRPRRTLAEPFGTSLADILTTALGCVLLLFFVAVLHIRRSLEAEQDARTAVEAALETTAEARERAERRRATTEAELVDATSARGQAERALRAARDAERAATARAEAMQQEVERLRAELSASQGRQADLRRAAATALADLDPRTAAPVDVVLAIDGTRSMGPSLDATRRNLQATFDALQVVSPTARVGVVVFRDKHEKKDVRLQQHPLTGDARALERFLESIRAMSTRADRDLPEWLCGGLSAAIGAEWRKDAIRLVIGVSDAGAQDPGARKCVEEAARFHAEGGRVYMLTTRPPGLEKPAHRRYFEGEVMTQHSAIADAGGGVHVSGAESETLLIEVLRAAFRSRTAAPAETLRRALEVE